MRLIDFEKLVIDELLSEKEFKEYLEENTPVLDFNMDGHLYSKNSKVDNIEVSTLEYLEEISTIPPLSSDIVEEAVDSMDPESKSLLITDNLKLVSYLGMLILKDGIDFMDLIQEGTVGLIQGVESYSSSQYNDLKEYLKINIARRMVLYIFERMEENKSEFLSYFNEKAEDYAEKEDLQEGIIAKMEEIQNISYFNLLNSIHPVEKEMIAMYYGFLDKRILSMYEIEKALNLDHGDGDAIFQNGINKLSRFGGELFKI